MFSRESGEILGGSGVHPHEWDARVFEIGYWLRPTATGHGYTREAVALLTRMAFEVLGANRVFIRCDALNERSARVAEACGYAFEGRHRRDALDTKGGLRDTLVYAMVREEYEAALPGWRAYFGGAG